MPPRPRRSGPRPTAGGAFQTSADSIPDPVARAQAERATRKGPPPGLVPESRPSAENDTKPPKSSQPVVDKARHGDGSVNLPRPSLSPSDGGGFALGLLIYVLGLNYLRHGKDGVTAWFKAKLLNKTTDFPGDPLASNGGGYGGGGGGMKVL